MDHGSSRAPSPGVAARLESVPALCCDLCEAPFSLPEHCREQGEILGLLVCTLCVEDQLEAQNYERTREAH